MKVADLRKLLETSQDKFNIFEDKANLNSCDDLTKSNLLSLISDFLDDVQKAKLFEITHFNSLSSHIKYSIIKLISDDDIKFNLIKNVDFIMSFEMYERNSLITSLTDDNKIKLLHMPEFLEEANCSKLIVSSLSNEKKEEILYDVNFIKKDLNIIDYNLTNLISSLDSDDSKLKLIDLYQFNNSNSAEIIKTFQDENKIPILLSNNYNFSTFQLEYLVSRLNVNLLVDFFKTHKDFFDSNGIKPYRITSKLNPEDQLDFVSKIEDIGFPTSEIRQILASLSKDAKENIDTSRLPAEYASALELKYAEVDNGFSIEKILVDFNKDLEIYRDLDELLYINPLEISENERVSLIKLCKICPDLPIHDNIGLSQSTAQEYISGETWINSVLDRT